MKAALLMGAICALPTAALAEDVRPGVASVTVAPVSQIVVPAHTEMMLRLDEEIGSDRARVGQPVAVSVARDVIVDGLVVIPRGTAGTGAVTYRTGKGAFGKSGKVDIELRSVDVGGRMVPVVGRYHAAGDGRTGETIGTILIGGVVAGAFVTGHHAIFEEGREFTAFTGAATPIARPTVRMARFVPPVTTPAMRNAMFERVGANGPLFGDAAPKVAPAYVAYGTLAQRLAAAQPVRGGDPRLGWTISD
ncbi:hypothetical protein C8J44_1640 [Sphingomonas sp. PP-CE-3A-406]|uniref:hypothetical protein n=1 Tax=Sphingomonas sp. PP-CE-3A-406 TaxID=2135659 RepID=UPI000F15CBFC|nr:hypothetical protein [Sphingomonas sp. PP-CE-3A-406]RMB54026.1 hypothetical protein C8J44_1640 [Sphingomonas sp. PP-CE-3A-406]